MATKHICKPRNRIIDAILTLWFYATTRRECCACGVWLGRSNPFGWRRTHGYCVDCSLDAHRKASDYLRSMIAQTAGQAPSCNDFGAAGSMQNNSVPSPAIETGESVLQEKQSYTPVADPMSASPKPFPSHNRAMRTES